MTKRVTPTPTTPTPDQVRAKVLGYVNTIGTAEKTGKANIAAATLDSFTAQVDALRDLGEYATTTLATMLPAGQALTGDNIAAMFAKDGALYPTDQAERDALRGKNVYMRALRAIRFDTPESRTLYLDGPAGLVAKCAALQGVAGHTPGVVAYHDWLGVMNAAEIATVKALDAKFLASFNIYADSTTGATIYAKRKPVVKTPDDDSVVKVSKDDAPVVVKVMACDAAALTALIKGSVYDIDIPADRMAAACEYILARYRLSLMDAPSDAPVAPAAKRTSF